MPIVIDANTFAPVFNESCSLHSEFSPVRAWITDGPGLVVYGGTKYKKELHRAYRYMRLVRQLKNANKAVEICQDRVDEREREIEELTRGSGCDDQHIIAIFCVSKCRLFCSHDGRADRYIKSQALYPKGQQRPKIYRSLANQGLLCRTYVVRLQNTT